MDEENWIYSQKLFGTESNHEKRNRRTSLKVSIVTILLHFDRNTVMRRGEEIRRKRT